MRRTKNHFCLILRIDGLLLIMSVAQCMQRRIVEQLMNDELKRIWKEAVMAYFEVLPKSGLRSVRVKTIA
jgi:hypothetical protein